MMNSEISNKAQSFAKQISMVASRYGLDHVQGKYCVNGEDIDFSWNSGRHGVDKDKVFITSTKRITVKSDVKTWKGAK